MSDLDIDYPYWLGGMSSWVVQTYLILRQYQDGLSIGEEPIRGAINIAHVSTWRNQASRVGEYRVSTRGDYRRKFDVEFEIVQNASNVKNNRQVYIPHWPLPRLLPRHPQRNSVKNVAYAGRAYDGNLALSLRSAGSRYGGLKFWKIDERYWHDMREIDVLVAVRRFSTDEFGSKPPSKLINAWRAGIPLIAGYDSAYSQVGTPGVDYIRVKSEAEMLFALQRLRDEPDYYRSIVEAGYLRCQDYSREKIADAWLRAIHGPISADWGEWRSAGAKDSLRSISHRLLDRCLDSASAAKAALRRVGEKNKTMTN